MLFFIFKYMSEIKHHRYHLSFPVPSINIKASQSHHRQQFTTHLPFPENIIYLLALNQDSSRADYHSMIYCNSLRPFRYLCLLAAFKLAHLCWSEFILSFFFFLSPTPFIYLSNIFLQWTFVSSAVMFLYMVLSFICWERRCPIAV